MLSGRAQHCTHRLQHLERHQAMLLAQAASQHCPGPDYQHLAAAAMLTPPHGIAVHVAHGTSCRAVMPQHLLTRWQVSPHLQQGLHYSTAPTTTIIHPSHPTSHVPGTSTYSHSDTPADEQQLASLFEQARASLQRSTITPSPPPLLHPTTHGVLSTLQRSPALASCCRGGRSPMSRSPLPPPKP